MNDAQTRSRKAAIIGFLIAGAALLGLSMFAQSHRTAATVDVPRRDVVDVVLAPDGSVVLRFRTPAPLALTSMGWVAGNLHLHALVDSVTRMAGAADLAHVAADTFQWTLPPLDAGAHEVSLFWADMDHRDIGDSIRHRFTVGSVREGTRP